MITTFDGHMHVPKHRVNAALLAAKSSGLDSLMFTNRNNTEVFDSLANRSLLLNNFEVEPVNDRYLIAYGAAGSINIYRGQEPRTKQGDILVWGASCAVEPGRDVIATIDDAIRDGAHVVLAHPFFSKGSVGSADPFAVYDLIDLYAPSDLSFEFNAQFPRPSNVNSRAAYLEFDTFRYPFYNSDTHGHHMFEHKKVGTYFFNRFPYSLEDKPHDALRSLATLPVTSDDERIERGIARGWGGRVASLPVVIGWNLHSALKDPVGKVKDVFGGAFEY